MSVKLSGKTKVCTKCKIEHPVENFYKNRTTKDGMDNQCMVCHKEYQCPTESNKQRNRFSPYEKLLVKEGHCKCTKCGIEKELSEFAKNKAKRSGRSSWCKLCHRGVASSKKLKNGLIDMTNKLNYNGELLQTAVKDNRQWVESKPLAKILKYHSIVAMLNHVQRNDKTVIDSTWSAVSIDNGVYDAISASTLSATKVSDIAKFFSDLPDLSKGESVSKNVTLNTSQKITLQHHIADCDKIKLQEFVTKSLSNGYDYEIVSLGTQNPNNESITNCHALIYAEGTNDEETIYADVDDGIWIKIIPDRITEKETAVSVTENDLDERVIDSDSLESGICGSDTKTEYELSHLFNEYESAYYLAEALGYNSENCLTYAVNAIKLAYGVDVYALGGLVKPAKNYMDTSKFK